MPKTALATLKGFFSTGKKPTQQNFWDFMDSYVHIDNQVAIDSQIVDQKIGAYDSGQASRNSDGAINSRGDIVAFLAGLSDTAVLKDIITALTTAAKWGTLPDKPASIALRWTEQTIDSTVTVPLPATGSSSQSWLCAPSATLNLKTYVVIDLKVTRTAYQPPSGNVLYFDQVTAVKLAVSPNTSLTT